MKCTGHKVSSTSSSYLKIIKRSFLEVLSLQPVDLFLMLVVSVSFAFLNRLGIRLTSNIFSSLQNTSYLGFSYIFTSIRKAFVTYILLIFLLGMRKIFINRFYIQYIAIPKFERKSKTKIQKISSELYLLDYDSTELHKSIYEAQVASTNIFRIVEAIISELGLLIGFLAISKYFLDLSWIYILLIFASAIPSLVEHLIKGKKKLESREKLSYLERKEGEIAHIFTNPNFILDNKVGNSYDLLNHKLSKNQSDLRDENNRLDREIFTVELALSILNILANLLPILLSIYFLYKNKDFGQFIATIMTYRILSESLKEIFSLRGYVSMFSKMVLPYFKLLDLKYDYRPYKALEFKNNISLENVSFKYPNSNTYALKNINLTINKGETIALVGRNGSGKTSLSKILLGLYIPTSGIVKIDGVEYKELGKVKDTYNWKSSVFQDYCKYPLTVRDNILISDPKIPFEYRDKKIDSLVDEIFKSPIDLDIQLGKEMGHRDLSGGQWQKLAISRALYRDYDFISLDEPTASIDPFQEKAIYQSFERALEDKTGLIVTHRLGSIKYADRIIVLDGGSLIESGSHKKLLEDKGLYSKMWESQKNNYVY